ncbi:hypothetical protein [Ciceribacter thiooxidans]|uniref:Uncharacterized protein n=1 Tax=Ciceribacter thiooxidans TaxID=1969821 RepID=A0ABV7I477_9HYPH|nr:hypothetical protein [Ciceribacter thiooxidans]
MAQQVGFRKSEVRQLAEIARRDGVRIELERNGVILRVGPGTDPEATSEKKNDPETLTLM